MNLKSATTLLIALLLITTLGAGLANSGRTQYLSVCQELMNQARSNEPEPLITVRFARRLSSR